MIQVTCQMKIMVEKNELIVEAAARMFARYGFAKTTIGDIATEAGVARQTVYNAFSGKDGILRAVVRHHGQKTYDGVISAWADATTVAEKLTIFQEQGPIAWFEAVRAAPDWAALIDGMHKAATEEIKVLDAQWIAALDRMLEGHDVATTDDGPSLREVAEFFYTTSLNAKYGAADLEALRRRLATIRTATLALLDGASA